MPCPRKKSAAALNLSGPGHELLVVRSYRVARRVAVLAAAVTSALAGVAAPASADVTVDPPSAAQGSGANLAFRVTNDNPTSALVKVVLTLPQDQPIAEVYPLSVDDWAPQLTNRPLNPPMPGLHGTLLTEATASVTWTVVPGREVAPGGTTELPVAVGPLPTTSTVSFTVQATYADGTTGPASGDLLRQGKGELVTLALTPAGAVPPAHGHQQAPPAPVVDQPPAAPRSNTWGLIGWLAAALCAAFGVAASLRARRSRPVSGPVPHAEARNSTSDNADRPERAKVTAWSYRDGP
jgi:hypothetical protein